ncbi:MAG: hypothetical protein E6R13_05705 [Spirochaetes bacterium]|nr:MAG: hypothetical protein E6R13_05705 [Spirochaetota bacterium]
MTLEQFRNNYCRQKNGMYYVPPPMSSNIHRNVYLEEIATIPVISASGETVGVFSNSMLDRVLTLTVIKKYNGN